MAEAVVRIEDMAKTYRSAFGRREVQAVRRLNLSVDRGSVVALVGPNGAGKTTTIYAMLGLLELDGGRVSLFDLPASDPAARRRVGFQSEIFYTYPFLSARSAMMFYARLSGIDPASVAADIPRILDRLGLGPAIDRKVGTYSKGMLQRLGLAQAILHRPELLILDEPTTGLDPEGRKLVAEMILEEKSRGTTVFLSSHILTDVERTCDRVIMIRDGEVVLSEPIDALNSGADEWEIEITTWNPDWQSTLGAFAAPRLRNGSARFSCDSSAKARLLRALLDLGADIGSVQRMKKSLEDLYMEYVGGSGNG